MKLDSQTSIISKQSALALDIRSIFWQQWQQYRDYLYRCCVKWMGGNPTDAEDALSRAMLKAWEKLQKYGGEITNFKAWLTTLAHNLCVDIHRERSRGANRVEDIDTIPEEQGLVSFKDTPLSALEIGEKKIVIRSAIANLPTRLRETFILYFYQELSYPEIAQQQEISYQNPSCFIPKGNFIEEFQKVSNKTSREIKAKRNELDFPLVRNPSLLIESGGASKLKKISNLENSESDRPMRLKNRIRHFSGDV
jgi:RNA polymerase sigma factor (sigma-70 family)